jgi:beta-galactosidase
MKFPKHLFLSVLLLFCCMRLMAAKTVLSEFKRDTDFNRDWKFIRCETAQDSAGFEVIDLNDNDWQQVQLPHTPRIEPLVVNDQWQGICWYRKYFDVNPGYRGKKIFIEFEGAMQIADVWINGMHQTTHYGGYLPFAFDITDAVSFSQANVIAVRLDNRDNPEVPPGKPLNQLDFCMYGGIYRNVKMHITDHLHISDPVFMGIEGGGGVFIRFEEVSAERATLLIQTHVINESPETRSFQIISELLDPQASNQGTVKHEQKLLPGTNRPILQTMTVEHPELWHPDHPNLYIVRSKIIEDGRICDSFDTRIGIRSISFSADGFLINGEKLFLRGTNRHQEYPYIGYALSDNAQKRDAIKIKKAGFDYIRLSHYPHAPAFMDACDELGIVVMNCIPGWQFFGNERFGKLCYQNCRELIRRDRNHPCVVLWEVSLNETRMDDTFLNETHAIAHKEYPGSQCYTCGWVDRVYDVFIQARQHGGCHGYLNGNKACVISEYGDWEYYAQNAGLDQPGFRDLEPEARNSRQLRSAGEKRLIQQAMNFQEAHNDNLSTPAAGDGLWVMFDYNRGYDDTIEASGTMDIFRIPKFSTYFFQSQIKLQDPFSAPMVHIASYWTEQSPPLKIFSNCDQVRLYLNGQEIECRSPDRGTFCENLSSPPFTFGPVAFENGELRAYGLINGQEVTCHSIRTPQSAAAAVQLNADLEGISPVAGQKDVFFIHAAICDAYGTLVPTATDSVLFSISGPGKLIGQNPFPAEAGIATILVETTGEAGILDVTAHSGHLTDGVFETIINP